MGLEYLTEGEEVLLEVNLAEEKDLMNSDDFFDNALGGIIHHHLTLLLREASPFESKNKYNNYLINGLEPEDGEIIEKHYFQLFKKELEKRLLRSLKNQGIEENILLDDVGLIIKNDPFKNIDSLSVRVDNKEDLSMLLHVLSIYPSIISLNICFHGNYNSELLSNFIGKLKETHLTHLEFTPDRSSLFWGGQLHFTKGDYDYLKSQERLSIVFNGLDNYILMANTNTFTTIVTSSTQVAVDVEGDVSITEDGDSIEKLNKIGAYHNFHNVFLEHKTVKKLNLGNWRLSKHSLSSLADNLSMAKHLKELNLADTNFVSVKQGDSLLRAIEVHPTLKEVKVKDEVSAVKKKFTFLQSMTHKNFVQILRAVLVKKKENRLKKEQALVRDGLTPSVHTLSPSSIVHVGNTSIPDSSSHLAKMPISMGSFSSSKKRGRKVFHEANDYDKDFDAILKKWDVNKFHKGKNYLSQISPESFSMKSWKILEQYSAVYNDGSIKKIDELLGKNKKNKCFSEAILNSLPLCLFCDALTAAAVFSTDENRLFATHSFLPEDLRIKFIQLKLKLFVEQYKEDLINNPETAAVNLIIKAQLLHPFSDKNSRTHKNIYEQITKKKDESFEKIKALGLEELFGIEPDMQLSELKVIPRSTVLFSDLDSYITAKRGFVIDSPSPISKRLCTLNRTPSNNFLENSELKLKVALFNECKARIEVYGTCVARFYCGDDTLPLLRTQYAYNSANDSVTKMYTSNFAFCYMIDKNPLTDYKAYINKSTNLGSAGKGDDTFVYHFNSIAFNGSVDEYLEFLKIVIERLEKVNNLFKLDKNSAIPKNEELHPLMDFIKGKNIENLNQLFEQYILNHHSYKNSYTIDKAYEEQSGSYKSLETIGNGVYATGEDKSILLPYTGVISFAEKAFDHDSWYVWSGRSKESIDGMIQTGDKNYFQLGSLINDTSAETKTTVKSPYNVQIVKLPGLILYLSKSLQKDVQLFVDYGSEYWKGRQRLKLNEKRINPISKKKTSLGAPIKRNSKENQSGKSLYRK